MSSTTRKVLSVLGVTAAIAAGVSLGGGTAMAADPPKCTATLKPGWGCLAVENKTRDPKVGSLRIGERGSCITNLVAGKTRYATGYAVAGRDVSPRSPGGLRFYTGSSCEGGTPAAGIAIDRWTNVDKHDYVTVTLLNS